MTDGEEIYGAPYAIKQFLKDLKDRIDELEVQLKSSSNELDRGILLGYKFAYEMMESRAEIYGAFDENDEDEN